MSKFQDFWPRWRRSPLSQEDRLKTRKISAQRAHSLEKYGLRTYGYRDSALLSASKLDSDSSYKGTFERAMPAHQSMEGYLLQVVTPEAAARGLVVVDVGGPGRKVVRDMKALGRGHEESPVFSVRRSLGITITDAEPDVQEHLPEEGHTVLIADLLKEEAEDQVDTWLGEDKVDVLFERMLGGIDVMPNDPDWFARRFDRWYKRLSASGVMFLQVPHEMNVVLEPWAKLLKEKYQNKLEVFCKTGHSNSIPTGESVIIIRKLPGAPEELEFLPHDLVRELLKKRNAGLDEALPGKSDF